MTTVLRESLALPALPGAAVFGLRGVLGLATAFLPSTVLLVDFFRFIGTKSGS